MPIYKFTKGGNGDPAEERRSPKPKYIEAPPTPKEQIQPFKIERQPDPVQDVSITDDDLNRRAEQAVRVFTTGFRLQDEGVLNFFSEMRVPDKHEGERKVNAILAGGDKTVLAWEQRRVNGRLPLPIVSVNRESAEFNPEKFSPPQIEMDRKFARGDKSKIEKIYRPSPWNLSYTATLWTERKDEAEYVLYQLLTRFNPMAQWIVEGEYHSGVVDAKFQGYTDSSDIDVAADEYAKVRYDFSVLVEGWLPLQREIVPAILGKIESMEVATDQIRAEILNGSSR